MTSSKREREYERRRYEKWQQRQAAHLARRRRLQVVVGSVLALVLVAVGVAAAIGLTRGDAPDAAATATTDPSATTGATASVTATAPDPSLAEARTWTGTVSLTGGDLAIELDGAAAPQAVASFVTLAQSGYFDGTTCHRVSLDLFVLQCGDPTATPATDTDAGSGGSGGPGYSFGPVENAPADNVYPAGTIAMARVSGDGASMGSQFFFVYADTAIPSDAAGGYTVFGRITSPLDVLQAIADAGVRDGSTDGQPASPVTIEGVEIQ